MLGNDTDPDGDTLTVTGNTQPAHSSNTVTVSSTGAFTYIPDSNYSGPDSFSYTISDGNGGFDTATVTITVTPVNDPPNAVNNSYSTNEDVTLSITTPGVLGNDTDPDGDTLTVTGNTQPAHSSNTVTVSSTGAFTYIPDSNYSGPDSFSYTISDGNGGSDTATVTITVTPVNDPPNAVNNSYSTNEDVTLSITTPGVLGNDTDPDGDTLTVTGNTQPANGTATVNPNGAFTYNPDSNFNGTNSFNYTISDGKGGTDTATVTITVTNLNDSPTANPQAVSTNEDTPRVITLTATDPDVGDTLTYSIVAQPTHGTLSGTGATRTYTPAADYNGTDSFTFRVTDAGGLSDTATVTVTVVDVNDPPVANAGGPYSGTAGVTLNVIGSGTDSDGTISTYAWSWGDGTSTPASTFAPAIHTYAAGGTYTITLTVTDDDGTTDTDTAVATVTKNAAPVVSVTSPKSGALVTGPLTVRVKATDVESLAGTLDVEYRIDTGLWTTATYNTFTTSYEGTVATTTLTDGSHSISARATDGFDNTTTSSSVTFIVDNNVAPTARITSPAANTSISGSVTVTATATDDKAVRSVQFFVDGVSIGTDSSSIGGWSVAWNTTKATSGRHTLTATAKDVPGKTGTSAPVIVTVDQPPTVDITRPRSLEVIKERVTIVASANDDLDIDQVEFFVDGVSIGTDTNQSGGWTLSWNTRSVDNGRRTIRAIAMDSNGQTTLDSIIVTVDNDLAPATTITSPRDGATIYAVGIVLFTATATDEEGVVQVEFFVDGSSIGVDDTRSDGWTAVWNAVRATIGSHTIRAVATDTLGQTAADSNQITIQAFTTPTTNPSASTTTVTFVEVDSPAEGLSATAFSLEPPTVSAGGEIALTVALAADTPGKADVQFLLDGAPLGEVATVNAVEASLAAGAVAVFTRTLPDNMQAGLHRVEAVTTDPTPRVLASRIVSVIAGETPDSGSAIPPANDTTDPGSGSSTPISLILAVVIGSGAALAAAGFGAAGWYRRKMIVRRLAARGR